MVEALGMECYQGYTERLSIEVGGRCDYSDRAYLPPARKYSGCVHRRDLTPILIIVFLALQGNVDWTFSVYALRSPARAILTSTISGGCRVSGRPKAGDRE
jgi:hypothetical protein